MIDENSIERQLQREANFVPPCCPNPSCVHHQRESACPRFWKKDGMSALNRFPYASQRFKCKSCKGTFAASIFQVYYRQKVWGLNAEIFDRFEDGASKRSIARKIGHSERLVRTRMRNFARFAELKHAKLTGKLEIEEPIVYDGLENFSYSQYDPNNINQAVGKNSLFIYDFNLVVFNRKGRVSRRQQKEKKLLENKFGRYDFDGIRTATTRILRRLAGRAKGELTIHSDEHFQYRRSVNIDLKGLPILHLKTSAKRYRNFNNPLFAVNNIDIQVRQGVSSFKRETISFSKHEISMQDDYLLHAIYRNYLRPKFWGTHRSDPECSIKSPAMELGLTERILSFGEFFSDRIFPTQVELNEDAKARYQRKCTQSRRRIAMAPAF
jgi:transposase-like protein